MSRWDEICAGVDRLAKKINESVEGAADQAALQLKLSTCRGNLEQEYKTLGRLTYEKLTVDENAPDEPTDAQDLTAQINATMARITAIRAEIAALEQKAKA